MLTCFKFPFTFDSDELEADLDRVSPDEWVRHFNDRYYEGDWSGVALRAIDGASNQIYPDPSRNESYRDTPLLSRCPSIQRALSTLECPIRSVRMLKLGAGARIIEHRDYNLGLEDGEARLHIPITTDPLVHFYLNGERLEMRPGECWYINANLPHKVDNRSDKARVHLVIDCKVNDWMMSMVGPAIQNSDVSPSEGDPDSESPCAPTALNDFCDLVFGNAGLQEKLRSVADQQLFIELVVRLGSENGYRFHSKAVAQKLSENRRKWFEKWV